MANKRKYIESHWLVYAFQGLISLLFGWFVMFTGLKDLASLTGVVGTTLLCLGVIEFFNLLYRKHYGGSLIISLIMAITEVAIALVMLFTQNREMVFPLVLLAIYTIGRGVLEIFLAFTSLTDKTDKFMWAVCGICGCVIGVVILNSGSFVDTTTFVKFFGTYMMIYGITNLIYGIHNKNELHEQKAQEAREKRLLARLAPKGIKRSESVKKAKNEKKAK